MRVRSASWARMPATLGWPPTWLRILSTSSTNTRPWVACSTRRSTGAFGPSCSRARSIRRRRSFSPGCPCSASSPSTFAWMRTTVERRARAGFAASRVSTARMSVVLPEPEEPMSRMLPTLRRASFLASATDISRTASFWPMTCFSSAAAIWAGDGGAGTGGFYALRPRRRRVLASQFRRPGGVRPERTDHRPRPDVVRRAALQPLRARVGPRLDGPAAGGPDGARLGPDQPQPPRPHRRDRDRGHAAAA